MVLKSDVDYGFYCVMLVFLQFHLFHILAKCIHSGQCFQGRKSFMLSIKAETGRVCWCYLLFSDSMMIHHEQREETNTKFWANS